MLSTDGRSHRATSRTQRLRHCRWFVTKSPAVCFKRPGAGIGGGGGMGGIRARAAVRCARGAGSKACAASELASSPLAAAAAPMLAPAPSAPPRPRCRRAQHSVALRIDGMASFRLRTLAPRGASYLYGRKLLKEKLQPCKLHGRNHVSTCCTTPARWVYLCVGAYGAVRDHAHMHGHGDHNLILRLAHPRHNFGAGAARHVNLLIVL